MKMRSVIAAACLLLFVLAAGAQNPPTDADGSDAGFIHADPRHSGHRQGSEGTGQAGRGAVGLDEKTGRKIPLDLSFMDSQGRPLRLGDFIDRPTIILLVFYTCPQSCNLMLADLARSLNEVPAEPGADYRVLAVSFDTDDDPGAAAAAKKNYFNILEAGFPPDEWRFLTGDGEAIERLTGALGFKFKKIGRHNFIHPNVLVVVAPAGTIIRYLHGVDFMPFDIGMALAEAARGTPGMSVKRFLSYCFSYDSDSRRYVFHTFRVAAVVVLTFAVFFFVIFLRRGRRKGGDAAGRYPGTADVPHDEDQGSLKKATPSARKKP